MSKMHKSNTRTAPQMTVHGGLTKKAPGPPKSYGVQGKASVNNRAVREGIAPTPKSISGRDA